MKLIRTKGRGAAQTAQILAALERRGGAALDTVLPAVRRIVADVRKRGDRALLRYAAQFDGLAGVEALRVTPEEMAAAWKSLDPALRKALSTAAKQIRAFCRAADAGLMESHLRLTASPLDSSCARLVRWVAMCPAAAILCLPRC